jgi:5-methylthioadenosine/S-adenosylhomocysteine deaminase
MHNMSPADLKAADYLLLPEQVMRKNGSCRDTAVVVSHGRFARVGPAAEVCAQYPHLTPRVLPQTLLMPGLIDGHTHLTQSL